MSWPYEPEAALEPPEEDTRWRCPVCHEELNYDDKVYVNCAGTVVGCCCCLDEEAAGETLEE